MSTIKDVARLAGVGVATASRALSGNGSVSGDTAERVRAAAASLGYRPSSIAQALSLRRSSAIGVYVPLFDAAYYSEMLSAIDRVLRAAGRHMIAANGCGTGSWRQKALDGIDFLIARDCDGIIVASNSLTDEDCAEVMQRCPNTVMLNRRVPGHDDRSFSIDHEAAGRLAARTLLAEGHREIAVIAGPDEAPDNLDRMDGFHAELRLHGLEVPSSRRTRGGFRFDGGADAMSQLLNHAPGFSAVFAANDLMAMAAISVLGDAGLRVPHDVSVMGYDDSRFARFLSPPLTTVHVPIGHVAANGCRLLLNDCYELDLPVERDFGAMVARRGSVARGPHAPIGERP